MPGIEKFKKRAHTAAWDDTISLEDKIVGVIGNGSRAVQIIPAIYSSQSTPAHVLVSNQAKGDLMPRSQKHQIVHAFFDMGHRGFWSEICW